MKRQPVVWTVVVIAAFGTACGAGTCGSASSNAEVVLTSGGENGPGLRQRPQNLTLPVPRDFELSHVEPAHFAAALGKDPSRIFEFVRDHVAFEPYAGSLRGPRGTLMAMAGNSLDRALLLGSLLRHSGHRVRFARGILPDGQARQLVASIFQRPPLATPAHPNAGELDATAAKLVADIERDVKQIHSSLKNAGRPATAESFVALDSLVQEAREHYWVEWWNAGAWLPMDASFATAAPGQVFAKGDGVWDELPEAVCHRVEIRVRVEEYTGTKAEIREVLTYSAKAADLSGVGITMAHEPTGSGGQGPTAVKPFLVVGSSQVHGSVFSLKPPAATAATAVLDAFGGGAEETRLATSESVELAFVSPGGQRQVVVREIFDRVGRSRRLKGEMPTTDDLASASTDDLAVGIYDFFFTTGAIDAWHLSDLTPVQPADPESLDVGAGLRRISTMFSTLSDLLTRRVAAAGGPVLRSYLESPRVQVSEWAPREGSLRISLDLRRDSARVLTSTFEPTLSFRAQVLRGVVSGHLERLVVEHFTRARDQNDLRVKDVMSTSSLFERARSAGVPFILLTRDRASTDSDLPEEARARIDEDLAANLWVLAPKQPLDVDGTARLAWWRIDPKSGTTVGVTDEGLHQAVEAVIIRTDIRGNAAYNVAFRVNGRFISTGGRLFRFGSRAEAENFVTLLGNRLTNMGMNFAWFAI